MRSPPLKEKPGATWTGATGQTNCGQTYSRAERLQASLARRLDRTASLSELIPVVVAKTLALTPRRDAQIQGDLFDDMEVNKP